MSQVQDRVTRVSSDLFEDAAAEGARQSRSARQQLDHWARVGRSVDAAQSVGVSKALLGQLLPSDLTADERTILNAEITARIEEDLLSSDYGTELAAEGVTTVALDDNGQLVEHRPDGTSAVLDLD